MEMIEDIAALDTIFKDSFPKEINKAKIKEIFEILQNQNRPDLIEEMKNLVLIKNCGEKNSNLTEEKRIDSSSPINQVLPTEMLKKILEKLDIRSLIIARQTCLRWKEIIDKFKFVEEASSKFLKIITWNLNILDKHM